MFDQQKTIIPLKEQRPSLKLVHSQSLQNVATRIDLAFKAFFRRCKSGNNPGYPRFRGSNRYDSFTYPQSGWVIENDYVKLSKIGKVKTVFHRPLDGTVKTCTVRRTATGKWFIVFSCEAEPNRLPSNSDQIGIDVGLLSFATLSDGTKVDNPRFFRHEQELLAKAQRLYEPYKKKEWSKEKQKKRTVIARVYERITNKRHDFAHQLSRRLVNKYGVIAVEDLSINDMQKDSPHCLNKSISDAAWRMFTELLSYKAEEAGRLVVKVNPAYTSQTCSNCGYRTEKKLQDRIHKCCCCGLELDRDHNAARNILTLGLQCLAGTA